MNKSLFEYVLRLGDNALINGQRLSQWCGHGPFLEEDVAVANTALDLIGRSRLLLSYAAEIEGLGRTEDDLAYQRNERDWRNLLIMELPRGDFAFTMARQFLIDTHDHYLYELMLDSSDTTLAGIAAKTVKECEYHLRRSRDWLIRLGQGTEQSHARLQNGMNEVWPYAAEFFKLDEVDAEMRTTGVIPNLNQIEDKWNAFTLQALRAAGLEEPVATHSPAGGRSGLHTEYMGYLLAEMQSVARAYPGVQW